MQLHHEQLQQRKKMRILSQMGFPNLAGSSPALALPGPGAGHSASMAAPTFGNVGASVFGQAAMNPTFGHTGAAFGHAAMAAVGHPGITGVHPAPAAVGHGGPSAAFGHAGPSAAFGHAAFYPAAVPKAAFGHAGVHPAASGHPGSSPGLGLEMQGQAQHQLRCLFSGEKMMPMSRSLHLVF